MKTEIQAIHYNLADFRVLCAWCGCEIRAPKNPSLQPAPESHGVCVSCAVKLGMPEDYFTQRNVA